MGKIHVDDASALVTELTLKATCSGCNGLDHGFIFVIAKIVITGLLSRSKDR